MKRLIPLLGVLVVVLAPVAAAAQTVSEVVAGLDDGVYVAAGLPASESDIAVEVNRARNAGFGLYVVLLEQDPPSGATAFAESTLNQLGSGTVLVLSATGEGMVSTEIDQGAIEAALDSGFAAGGGDVGYVRAVVSSVTGTSAGTDGSDSGGSSSGLVLLLVIVGGLVLLVAWVIHRSKKASDERRGDLIGEARAEIKSQLDAMANTILEITDLVSASETGKDNEYLEKAGSTYAAALEAYEEATELRALEDLSDRLDEARWELDAAAALSQGRPIPDKPEARERPVCFFDPTHRDATEMVDIETATGTRTVRVCREDAERLRKGQQPTPRMINVGGRRVPAPMAPRSHGGGGMDWLGMFTVLAGGAGQAASYDWGRGRSGRGRSAGSRTGRSRTTRGSARSATTRSRAGRTRRRRR